MGLITNILMVIVIVVIIVFVYNYLNSTKIQLSNLKSASKVDTTDASKLPSNKASSNYAYSIWFYVKNWQYRLTEKKELLSRSSNNSDNTANPRITLAAYENNININVATYPSSDPNDKKTSTDDLANHDCIIRNFPLQKWVNLIVSLNGRTLDVYLDGKLVRTCVLPGVAKIDPNASVNITPDGGFSGWTSNMQYWSHPLNPQEAYNIYKKGYGGGGFSGLGGLFDKYKIKVAYLVDNEEEGSFSI
jgi:hypothetical protein